MGHFLFGVGHFLPVVVVVDDGVFIQAVFSMDNALKLVYQTLGETFPSLSQTGEGFLLKFEKEPWARPRALPFSVAPRAAGLISPIRLEMRHGAESAPRPVWPKGPSTM